MRRCCNVSGYTFRMTAARRKNGGPALDLLKSTTKTRLGYIKSQTFVLLQWSGLPT